MLVDEPDGVEEVVEPVDRLVLQLQDTKLAIKLGGERVEGDGGERANDEVVGYGVDLVAGDKVCLLAGPEVGDIAG